MGFWPVTKRVIKDSDIILLILDARMPEFSKNKELERMIDFHDKTVIYVFNKIDIVSQRYLESVRKMYPEAFFVSGVKNIGISNLKKNLLIRAKKMKIKDPKIGVVGYPNVGKSAIINALAKRARAKVSKKAGTTKGIQWIKAGGLMVLDSPGVVPYEDNESMLGVMGAKNIEKIVNVEKIAYKIIRMILNHDKKILERYYEIKITDDNFDSIFHQIAIKRGFLLKKGVVDERRAALTIIRDWHAGKFRL